VTHPGSEFKRNCPPCSSNRTSGVEIISPPKRIDLREEMLNRALLALALKYNDEKSLNLQLHLKFL